MCVEKLHCRWIGVNILPSATPESIFRPEHSQCGVVGPGEGEREGERTYSILTGDCLVPRAQSPVQSRPLSQYGHDAFPKVF